MHKCERLSQFKNSFHCTSHDIQPILYLTPRFEEEVFSEWTQGVDEVASANLEKPLLLRSKETHLLSVNFDPKV